MIERALLPFLRGLVALLERLPQKGSPVSQVQDTQPTPQPQKLYVFTGEDRELIEAFLRDKRLTDDDLQVSQ